MGKQENKSNKYYCNNSADHKLYTCQAREQVAQINNVNTVSSAKVKMQHCWQRHVKPPPIYRLNVRSAEL